MFDSSQTSEKRTKLIRDYQKVVTANSDTQAGKQLFTKHCGTCHQYKGIGHKVGPDLATLKNRSVPALVTAILDPGAAVEDKYVNYSVLTHDGVVHAGIIAGETTTAIEMRLADGKTKTIVRSDIERIHTSGQSLMPEGMEKNITPEQMGHLIGFLNDGTGTSKSQPGNNPVTIQAKADGTLDLPAAGCQMHGEQLRFEQRYGNIGFWNQADEYVTWAIEVPTSGKYEVIVDYACPEIAAGNICRLNCEDQVLRATVTSTGNWDQYHKLKMGTLDLTQGSSSIRFGADGDISGWLMDLRALTLRPTSSTPAGKKQ